MTDTYQAVYDAVCSRLSRCDVGEAVREVARHSFDLGMVVPLAQEAIAHVSYEMQRPSVLMRPTVMRDGDKWCALYGANLMEGVAGFGDSPELACEAFDKEWRTRIERSAT